MTNGIALVIGLVLIAAVGADLMVNDGNVLVFLSRKFVDLVEWVEFWN